jgi:YD repeat-containing protein
MVLLFLFSISWGTAQEVLIKKREDYQLKGPVKKCTVLTSYGKEVFEFNRKGWLERITSFFNETDYHITNYIYSNSGIKERRIEYYEGGIIDREASIANFYQKDSVSSKIISENVVDYTGNLIEQKSYVYDSLSRVKTIYKRSPQGRFTTQISYSKDSLGSTFITAYYLDSIINKKVFITLPKKNDKEIYTHVTKQFLDSEPVEESFVLINEKDEVTLRETSFYDPEKESWVLNSSIRYRYDSKGKVVEQKTQQGNSLFTQQYTYQVDGTPYSNWIKQIILPNLTYTTRIVEYFTDDYTLTRHK